MGQEERTDLRFRRTEQALVQAFSELLKTMPMDKISVSDLCNAAMIRRATFYAHYRDKTDFLTQYMARCQAHYAAKWMEQDGCADPIGQMTGVLYDMLCFMEENRALLDQVTDRLHSPDAMRMFAGQMTALMRRKACEHTLAKGCLPVPPEILAAFFTGALLGVGRWWYTSEQTITKEALAEHVRVLLTQCIPSMQNIDEDKGERQ